MRESSGYRQQDVADFLGVGLQRISSFERGYSSFSYREAKRICDFIDANVDDLFDGCNEVSLTYTYLTYYLNNRQSLSYKRPSIENRKITKKQRKLAEKWTEEVNQLAHKFFVPGKENLTFGGRIGKRNTSSPEFLVRFPQKSNKKLIVKLKELGYSVTYEHIESEESFYVVAIMAKELKVYG